MFFCSRRFFRCQCKLLFHHREQEVFRAHQHSIFFVFIDHHRGVIDYSVYYFSLITFEGMFELILSMKLNIFFKGFCHLPQCKASNNF